MNKGQKLLCSLSDCLEGQTYEAFLFKFFEFVTYGSRKNPKSRDSIVLIPI